MTPKWLRNRSPEPAKAILEPGSCRMLFPDPFLPNFRALGPEKTLKSFVLCANFVISQFQLESPPELDWGPYWAPFWEHFDPYDR